jgi:hypothetical protein
VNVKQHLEAIASLGCVVCRRILDAGYVPAMPHHIGSPDERNDWLTIPLCHEHHQGSQGVHVSGLGLREFCRRFKTNETRLLGMTIEDLAHAGR